MVPDDRYGDLEIKIQNPQCDVKYIKFKPYSYGVFKISLIPYITPAFFLFVNKMYPTTILTTCYNLKYSASPENPTNFEIDLKNSTKSILTK